MLPVSTCPGVTLYAVRYFVKLTVNSKHCVTIADWRNLPTAWGR